MSRRSLAGSRVLLTGASSGIGRALAHELAGRQAKLVAVARRKPLLEQLAEEIRAVGAEITFVEGDLTDERVRSAAVAAAQRAYGGLDVLINNAGVGALGLFENADEARLRSVMEINFFAPAALTRSALPLLRHGAAPLVVNIGSILGYRAIPRMSEYCASKFALTGLSESLSAEFGRLGIDVMLVSPGRTVSEFQQNLLADRGESHWPGLPQTDVTTVARRIIRGMERGRKRLFPNWSAKCMYWGNRLAPGLLDRFLAGRA